MEKELVFEGAGWDCAEHNGVGNCRIRTRIKNKKGKVIYLEMGRGAGLYESELFVDHCFYMEDERTNYSPELSKLQTRQGKYNKASILSFVNSFLNCDFTTMKVYNKGLRVHETKEPLCSCEVPQ